MLDVFQEAKKYNPDDPSMENQALRQKLLQEIGVRMASGEPPKEFDSLLDTLTGSGLPERDEDIEERWQRKYQGSRAE